MPRTLAPGQRARIWTIDVDSGERRLVHDSDSVLFEAPNWTLDGAELVVNGDDHLHRLPVDGSRPPERIVVDDLPPVNNDHVLDPDGLHVFASADDGHIHRVPIAGGAAVRCSNDNPWRHFLHGVSADGRTLSYVGLERHDDGTTTTDVLLLVDGRDVRLTHDAPPDDGPEPTADGDWLYWNSERGSTTPGHAQLFRMRLDGSEQQQITHDERVNWFPHPSPRGDRLVFVSFPPGTLGHPADRDVIVRVAAMDGSGARDLVHLHGGQGTMNVPSWSPDGGSVAYVDYPVG